jgi:hypothetical protein
MVACDFGSECQLLFISFIFIVLLRLVLLVFLIFLEAVKLLILWLTWRSIILSCCGGAVGEHTLGKIILGVSVEFWLESALLHLLLVYYLLSHSAPLLLVPRGSQPLEC